VEVEDITGVGFTAWGPPEEERHLPVSDGLFGKIVEDDDGVAVVITEPLSHGATRVGSEVLEGSWVGSSGDDYDRVFKSIVPFEDVDKLGNGGLFLADSDVDAVKLLGFIVGLVEPLLVEHAIKSDSGFTGLPITNDQLTLTPTNWYQRIDAFKTGLHGLVDGFPGNDTWGFDVNSSPLFAVDGTFAVKWVTESVDNTSEELWADWHIDNSTGPSDDIAFFDVLIFTEHDDTNVIGFQVQSHTFDARVEFYHLFGLDVFETVDTGNTITDSEYLTGFLEIDLGLLAEDSLFEEVGEFRGTLLVAGNC